MYCFGPNRVGYEIEELKVGEEILILAGEGTPAVERDTKAIIWRVEGYSALTAAGHELNCHNISKVIRTGGFFEEFLPSTEAEAIWQRVLSLRSEE